MPQYKVDKLALLGRCHRSFRIAGIDKQAQLPQVTELRRYLTGSLQALGQPHPADKMKPDNTPGQLVADLEISGHPVFRVNCNFTTPENQWRESIALNILGTISRQNHFVKKFIRL
ncbi:hypothetical protein SAMN04487965_2359 [Microbulbifer donghaiensis]|uniref:Uncharacterized protein n=1 Tax=Microbulbifer donghaiensis TaxID=494016 RepID=A0A1M5CZQ6_9GAMM|nr:hypothetical protein SAMN04487965_2359 [Microbulbifer donghaiensis]